MDGSINPTYFSFANLKLKLSDSKPGDDVYDSSVVSNSPCQDVNTFCGYNLQPHIMNDLPACRLSQQDLKYAIDTLTPSQHQAFELVTNNLFEDSQPLRLFISSGGGTGKSFLMNVIIAYIQHLHAILCGKFLVTAPTGTAARNIHGQTIHSLLNIPVTTYN